MAWEKGLDKALLGSALGGCAQGAASREALGGKALDGLGLCDYHGRNIHKPLAEGGRFIS